MGVRAQCREMREVTQPVIKTRVLQRTDTAEQTDRNQRLLPRAWGEREERRLTAPGGERKLTQWSLKSRGNAGQHSAPKAVHGPGKQRC